METSDALSTGRLSTVAVPADEVVVAASQSEVPRLLYCSICGATADQVNLPTGYSNPVCKQCDNLAVNESGDAPWHGYPPGEWPETEDGVIVSPPDRGENPVFIAGAKCWRRYRFGGWITRRDAFDCQDLREFHYYHRVRGEFTHAFNTPKPDGVDVSDPEPISDEIKRYIALTELSEQATADDPDVDALHDAAQRLDCMRHEAFPDRSEVTAKEFIRIMDNEAGIQMNKIPAPVKLCTRYHNLW